MASDPASLTNALSDTGFREYPQPDSNRRSPA
jgi:hypothetical protein